jgi:hypothetical protein
LHHHNHISDFMLPAETKSQIPRIAAIFTLQPYSPFSHTHPSNTQVCTSLAKVAADSILQGRERRQSQE